MYKTLISAADLAPHIDSPNWAVIDCRHDLLNPQAGHAGYAIGHISHALFANVDTDLSGPKVAADGAFRGRHPLPERDAFIETLRGWGINGDTQVVAYDAHGAMFAARLWWMLRWVGHQQVAVLDGGLAAWQAGGYPMSTEAPIRERGMIMDRGPLVETVSAAEILQNLAIGSRVVIDARSADRFRGENETMDPVGGHIPGAKNRFFKDNLQADGRFKDAAQLKADFAGLMAEPKAAIMQCGSGVTACHNLLALEVAGLPGAALYPGSWSEWSADPSRPVHTGA